MSDIYTEDEIIALWRECGKGKVKYLKTLSELTLRPIEELVQILEKYEVYFTQTELRTVIKPKKERKVKTASTKLTDAAGIEANRPVEKIKPVAVKDKPVIAKSEPMQQASEGITAQLDRIITKLEEKNKELEIKVKTYEQEMNAIYEYIIKPRVQG